MKIKALILSALLLLAHATHATERGEHRISGDGKLEFVYLDGSHALMRFTSSMIKADPADKDKNVFVDVDSYSICPSKYAGAPEVVEFTGDIPGKPLVAGITQLHLFKDTAIGTGLDPNDKGPLKQTLYFIADLKGKHASFFQSEKSFREALSNQFGIKKQPLLLPPDRLMKNLKQTFDSRHK